MVAAVCVQVPRDRKQEGHAARRRGRRPRGAQPPGRCAQYLGERQGGVDEELKETLK